MVRGWRASSLTNSLKCNKNSARYNNRVHLAGNLRGTCLPPAGCNILLSISPDETRPEWACGRPSRASREMNLGFRRTKCSIRQLMCHAMIGSKHTNHSKCRGSTWRRCRRSSRASKVLQRSQSPPLPIQVGIRRARGTGHRSTKPNQRVRPPEHPSTGTPKSCPMEARM